MRITSTLTNSLGQVLPVEYFEGGEPTKNLEGRILRAVHAYCFCDGKLVVVTNQTRSIWVPPGGSIEPGETFEMAVVREVQEETNMKVIHQRLIGFQDIFEPERIVRQTRSFCIVEPYGDFIADPDGDIFDIKLIDPKDYKQYFDWKEIGDRIMDRALEMFAEYK